MTNCWYPSSGVDFYSINHWYRNLDNKLKPTEFIFTDKIFNSIEIPKYYRLISTYLNIDRSQISHQYYDSEIDSYYSLDNELQEENNTYDGLGHDEIELLKQLGLYNQSNLVKAPIIKINAHKFTIKLIKCTNANYFDYLIHTNQQIDTIMLHRHMDGFIYNNEAHIIKTLNIRECFGAYQYITWNENNRIDYDILWKPDNEPIEDPNTLSFNKYI